MLPQSVRRYRKDYGLSLLLLLPTLLIFTVFMFWPLIRSLQLSFYDWNMISPTKDFVGLSNYTAIFTDPAMKKVMVNTLWYILLFITIDFVIPYIIAFILSFVVKRLTSFYRTALFTPSLISLVVGAIIMSWMLNPLAGPLATIFDAFGQDFPNWAQQSGLVIVVLSLITSWRMFGYNVIILLAGVSSISLDLIEAAKLERTPNWEIFMKIVVPLSAPTGLYVLIITLVSGLQWVFTPISVLTQGGPNNASSNIIYEVYHKAFTLFHTGSASALAIISMALFLLLLILEIRFVERSIHYEN